MEDFREATIKEQKELSNLLSKQKSIWFVLLIPVMIAFVAGTIGRIWFLGYEESRNFIFVSIVVVVICLFVMLYTSGVEAWKRYSVISSNVTIADAVCINVKSYTVDNEHTERYYCKLKSGKTMKLKRSVITRKPSIGEACKVVDFGCGFYSVWVQV